MKSRPLATILAVACVLGGTTALSAQETKSEPKEHKPRRIVFVGADSTGEKQKITYLGVETAPVPRALAAHLGLSPDHGLTINAVAEDSPAAAAALQQHDVLTKFDDQVLVDSRQLSVLIRAKRAGDEVKLTLIRAGKEQRITVKLGERELPHGFGFRALDPSEGGGFRFLGTPDGAPALERLQELPGLARDELNDVLRLIGRERGNWFGSPRVHIFRRGDKGGSTILNLAEGNFVFSDNEGTVEVVASAGDRQLTVKDAKGAILFQGPINNDEQREKLPDAIKERLKKIEAGTFEFEAGADLQQEGAALPPSPRTKTSSDSRPPVRPLLPSRPF